MSPFYKSNLMDTYNSPLIPPEKDIQKEDVEKNKSNVEENKTTGNAKRASTNVYFPYKGIIKGSHYLIYAAPILFIIYMFYKMPPREGGRLDGRGQIIPEKFFDPCNATNAISLDDIEKIRNKIRLINGEKHSINVVVGYNMSTSANVYLAQKLANLTEASNALYQQIEEQKEIRFNCYKKNLEKRCKEQSFSEQFKTLANGVYVYFIAVTILLLNSFYYISKARKRELSDEQKRACDQAHCSSQLIIFHHIFCGVFMTAMSYFFVCSVDSDLDKFSM